jgi:hypothetical protein
MLTKYLRSTYYLIVQKSHFIYRLLQPFPVCTISRYAARDLLSRLSEASTGVQHHVLMNVCLFMSGYVHFNLLLILCLGIYKEVYTQYYRTRNTSGASCAVKNCLCILMYI